MDAPPDIYAWKGSHVSVTVSPDGRFAVTAMQESALHGWRLSDHANMRMSGYPSRVRSLAWSGDGAWLATSGADACVIWPFRDKDGPMNKAPRECAVREAKVSRVAFNPKSLLLAIGYEDGWVLLCRLADGVEMLVRRNEGERHRRLRAGLERRRDPAAVRDGRRRGRPPDVAAISWTRHAARQVVG